MNGSNSEGAAFILNKRDPAPLTYEDGTVLPPMTRQLWVERNPDGGAHFGISLRDDEQEIPHVAGLNLTADELATLLRWAAA